MECHELHTLLIYLTVFRNLQNQKPKCKSRTLLDKLRVYGVRGIALDWFRTYLANRQQYVKFKNNISERHLVDCGVRQGLIPGPLLFQIFINDFPNCSIFLRFFFIFKQHIAVMCPKLSQSVDLLHRLNHSLSQEIMKKKIITL